MERTVGEIIAASRVLSKLCEQDLSYSVTTGYRLLKLRDELTEVSDYAISRIGKVIDLSKDELTEEETLLYGEMMLQPVEIPDCGLTEDGIFNPSNGEVVLTLNETEIVRNLLKSENPS